MGRVSWKRLLLLCNSLLIVGFIFSTIDLESLLIAFRLVSIPWLISILTIVGMSILGVTWRLHRMLDHFSAHQKISTSLKATISGLASSLIVINLIGSILGRQFVLRRHGVSPSLLTILAGYERIVQAFLGGTLAAIGAYYLYGKEYLSEFTAQLPIAQLSASLVMACIMVLFCTGLNRERRYVLNSLKWRDLYHVVEVLLITLSVQGLMTLTYVLAFFALGNQLSLTQAIAGAAIVSFAAALPISVNGWGVRELAAIAVFGEIGASAHDAVAASILVGLCSTMTVMAASPYALLGSKRKNENRLGNLKTPAPAAPHSSISDRQLDGALALICGAGAAVLTFFQVKLDITGTAITANLSDPIALSAVSALSAYALFQRRLPIAFPNIIWLWLGGITVILLYSFLNGVLQFGVTAWALSNRVFGWIVIFGYITCGALITSQFGARGRRILLGATLVTAVAVLIVQLSAFTLHSARIIQISNSGTFAGYSSNRNTFAIMLLLAAASMPCLRPTFLSPAGKFMRRLAGGLIFFGIWQTGSKLGLTCLMSLIAFSVIARSDTMKDVFSFLIFSVLFYFLFHAAPAILNVAWTAIVETDAALTARAGLARSVETFTQSAIDERYISFKMGLSLWLSHPFLGSGLGAAIRQNLGFGDTPLVIHSTSIWILAEFGIVGLLVVISLPCYLLWQNHKVLWLQIRRRNFSSYQVGIFGICLVFALFGLGHEIAYQRLFWLLFGSFSAQAVNFRIRTITIRA